MKKRILAAALALCLTLGLLPIQVLAVTPASGKCGDNINWYFQDDGMLLLDGSGEPYDYGYWSDDPAPWKDFADQINYIKIQGRITHLGESLFSDCTSATEILLNQYLEHIDPSAFPRGGNLQYFMIDSNSGEYVVHDHVLYSNKGKTLFMYPPALNNTSFTVPDGVTEISGRGFSGNPYLEKITLNDGISEISTEFQGCFALKEVLIPLSVTTVDPAAFWYSDQLNPVIIPTSVKTFTADHALPDGFSIDYNLHKDFYFRGDAPSFDINGEFSVSGDGTIIRTDIYYPDTATGWAELIQRFGEREDMKFYPYTLENTTPKYTVSYELDGGNGGPPSGSYADGAEVTIPDITPVKDGYTFTWWKQDGAPVLYKPGQTFTILGQDVKLIAQWEERIISSIDEENVFIKQSAGDGKCTLVSATMMLRRRAILDGITDWESITETAVGSSSWGQNKIWRGNDGLSLTFEYRGMYTTTYVGANVRNMLLAERKEYFISQLLNHPEGIVVYRTWDGKQQHAVLLTSYDAATDTFYCADPAGNTKGIVPLTESTMGVKADKWENKTQDNILSVLTQVWIITKTKSQRTLVSSSISAHCPVDMSITIGGETLDSRKIADFEQNSYAEMSISGTADEKNIDVIITGDYAVSEDIDVDLYGVDIGYMTFEITHYFSDGTLETHTFENILLTNTSIGTASGFYPQSTVLLFMKELDEKEGSIWVANSNETAIKSSTDFEKLPPASEQSPVDDDVANLTLVKTPDKTGYTIDLSDIDGARYIVYQTTRGKVHAINWNELTDASSTTVGKGNGESVKVWVLKAAPAFRSDGTFDDATSANILATNKDSK